MFVFFPSAQLVTSHASSNAMDRAIRLVKHAELDTIWLTVNAKVIFIAVSYYKEIRDTVK